MNKRLIFAVTVIVLFATLVSCGKPPVQPTAVVEPTKVPPTAEPTAEPATVTLWHGWTGAEETTLKDIIAKFQAANPNITINPLAVPFDQLQSKFTTEAGAGGGPDILIGPVDWVGPLAEAGLLAPLDDLAKDYLGDYLPSTVNALKWQGKLYGFPESFEAVAMYYNKSIVTTPPKTLDELLTMAPTVGVAFNTGFYHSFGFIPAFGGKLFDDTFTCVLDKGGTVDWLQWLLDHQSAQGVTFSDDGGKLDTMFKDGQAGIVFNGPWGMGDYVGALGADKVGVAPLPAGPNPAGPFLGVKHIMFNANASDTQKAAALKFVVFMTSGDSELALVNNAGHLPANTKVAIPEGSASLGFIEQAKTATPFPNVKEMGAVWGPGGDMIKKVLTGDATPADSVTEATKLINEGNKKTVAP